MAYECKIVLDSISETGKRLTTFQITFPRVVLAEMNTHRMFSRNSASSRAIPIRKMIDRALSNPFIPEKFGKPEKGMGAKEYWSIDSIEHINLTMTWRAAMTNSIRLVEAAKDFGNKEDLNRLLEPFLYHTCIVTATEFDNFFKLRTNSSADWKIKKIADLMYECYHAFDNFDYEKDTLTQSRSGIKNPMWLAKRPQKLKIGEWHCPLISKKDWQLASDYQSNFEIDPDGWGNGDHNFNVQELIKKISVARCARVSYLTHDGKRDIEKDLELFERLRTSGHWSPFEHVCTPYYNQTIFPNSGDLYNILKTAEAIDDHGNLRSGNLYGFQQYRKEFQDENCVSFRKEN